MGFCALMTIRTIPVIALLLDGIGGGILKEESILIFTLFTLEVVNDTFPIHLVRDTKLLVCRSDLGFGNTSCGLCGSGNLAEGKCWQ